MDDIEAAIALLDDETDVVITGYPADKNPYFNMVERKADGSVGLVVPSGASSRQAAPTVYAETALVEDCPQPGPETAVACCARGSLHGCNIAGHQAALANDWAGAKPHYQKVCAAGVRIAR